MVVIPREGGQTFDPSLQTMRLQTISAVQNSERHTQLQHNLMLNRWAKWYANNHNMITTTNLFILKAILELKNNHMLADFGNKRMFILYGPGGVGKSSVINILLSAIGGSTCSIDTKYTIKQIKYGQGLSMPKDIVQNAASCIVALVSDLEVVGDTVINVQTVKHLTGGDQIHGVKLSDTVLCSMNTLPVYKVVNTYVKPDRIRRIVVIPS